MELEPGRLVLSWTPRTDHVVFQVEARTLGYVGVGFSRDGSLNGADIVIGWIEDDNQKAFLLVSVLKIYEFSGIQIGALFVYFAVVCLLLIIW